MTPAPPRLALRIAQRAVRVEAWQQDVLGDLIEEFADIRSSRGDGYARR